MANNPLQYFVSTACVFNLQGQVLLTRRYSPQYPATHNLWQLPGGGINYGENPDETALRETHEETGIIFSITDQYPLVYSHLFRGDAHIVIFVYTGEYISGDIDISADRDETSEAGWFSLEELLKLEFMPKTKDPIVTLLKRRIMV